MPRCFYAEIDVTELEGTDNLYYPQGIIKNAQEDAARIFGAKEILFLTSGATQGIFAMLGAFKNQCIRVERNCHKSIFEACQLFNIRPVFDGGTNAPSARIVTYPDYYGNTVDIKSIYNDCKEKGIYLLVDAAHGSHFGFSPRLPESASPYCDAFVMSAHKTLPALTQGAYLAINNESLAEGIKTTYKNLGTTSPSYPIMASLDYAARHLKTHGAARFEKLFTALQKFKAKLPPQIKACESNDFTRLVLEVGDGFEFQKKLNAAGVYPEFADTEKVIFILSVCDTSAALRRLSKAVAAVWRGGTQGHGTTGGIGAIQIPAPVTEMPFLTAGNAPRESVDIAAAAGRVAAGEVGFYPPGIPLVIRGEMITKEICDIISLHKDKLFGLTDGKVSVIK